MNDYSIKINVSFSAISDFTFLMLSIQTLTCNFEDFIQIAASSKFHCKHLIDDVIMKP